jgi:hypothetical protein
MRSVKDSAPFTATEHFSLKMIRELIRAPKAHLEMEPPECLAELVDVAEEHLYKMARFSGRMQLEVGLKQIREKWCERQGSLI